MIDAMLDKLLSSDVVEARPNGQQTAATVLMTVGAMKVHWRRRELILRYLGMGRGDNDDEKMSKANEERGPPSPGDKRLCDGGNSVT